jgi:hypothetical protein
VVLLSLVVRAGSTFVELLWLGFEIVSGVCVGRHWQVTALRAPPQHLSQTRDVITTHHPRNTKIVQARGRGEA